MKPPFDLPTRHATGSDFPELRSARAYGYAVNARSPAAIPYPRHPSPYAAEFSANESARAPFLSVRAIALLAIIVIIAALAANG